LGNPGQKYAKTRHNVGYDWVDWWRGQEERRDGGGGWSEWREEGKFQAEVSKNGAVVLLKPLTMMNLSGQAVAKAVRRYQIEVGRELVVAFDDLDLKVGTGKVQWGRGPKGHRGLESIYQALGGEKGFWHVRIGVDGREGLRRETGEEYVLGQLSPTQRQLVTGVFGKLGEAIDKQWG
jgi:PTH1 family peptidyl-tRNA hydrolase